MFSFVESGVQGIDVCLECFCLYASDPREIQMAGSPVDVRDASHRWYTGRVLDVRQPDQVLVHFDGTLSLKVVFHIQVRLYCF